MGFPQALSSVSPHVRSTRQLRATNSIIVYVITVLNELLIEGNPQDRTRSLNQQRQESLSLVPIPSLSFNLNRCLIIIEIDSVKC